MAEYLRIRCMEHGSRIGEVACCADATGYPLSWGYGQLPPDDPVWRTISGLEMRVRELETKLAAGDDDGK